MKSQLSERNADHQQHAGPQEPETWRGRVRCGSSTRHGSKVHPSAPFLVAVITLLEKRKAKGDPVVHESRTDDAVAENFADDERNGRVEADQDAGTDKGRRELENPEPVLAGDRRVVVVAPDVEPGENVPVPQDTEAVLRDDAKNQGSREGPTQSHHLHLGNGLWLKVSRQSLSGVRRSC